MENLLKHTNMGIILTTGYINQFMIGWKRYPTVYTDLRTEYVREIPIGHN